MKTEDILNIVHVANREKNDLKIKLRILWWFSYYFRVESSDLLVGETTHKITFMGCSPIIADRFGSIKSEKVLEIKIIQN